MPDETLYPTERARLLRQHADALEEMCVGLSQMSENEDELPSPHATVGHFVNALLASAVQADGQRTASELAVISAYFRDGWELRDDDDEWARDADRVATEAELTRPQRKTALVCRLTR